MLSGNPCAPAQMCHLNVCTGALSSAILRTPVPAMENVQGFKSWKAEMTPTTQVAPVAMMSSFVIRHSLLG